MQNFLDYATVNDELVTSSIRTLDEIIADINYIEQIDNEEKEDDSVSIPTITDDLQHFLELRKLLFSLIHAEKMFCYINKVGNFLSEKQNHNFKQQQTDSFFLSTSKK